MSCWRHVTDDLRWVNVLDVSILQCVHKGHGLMLCQKEALLAHAVLTVSKPEGTDLEEVMLLELCLDEHADVLQDWVPTSISAQRLAIFQEVL